MNEPDAGDADPVATAYAYAERARSLGARLISQTPVARLIAANDRIASVETERGRIETGTVFMNRCDYLDPALCWTGCKDTGRGAGLSVLGYQSLTRPKSYHLKQ